VLIEQQQKKSEKPDRESAKKASFANTQSHRAHTQL
jgi:hypothetical protein